MMRRTIDGLARMAAFGAALALGALAPVRSSAQEDYDSGAQAGFDPGAVSQLARSIEVERGDWFPLSEPPLRFLTASPTTTLDSVLGAGGMVIHRPSMPMPLSLSSRVSLVAEGDLLAPTSVTLQLSPYWLAQTEVALPELVDTGFGERFVRALTISFGVGRARVQRDGTRVNPTFGVALRIPTAQFGPYRHDCVEYLHDAAEEQAALEAFDLYEWTTTYELANGHLPSQEDVDAIWSSLHRYDVDAATLAEQTQRCIGHVLALTDSEARWIGKLAANIDIALVFEQDPEGGPDLDELIVDFTPSLWVRGGHSLTLFARLGVDIDESFEFRDDRFLGAGASYVFAWSDYALALEGLATNYRSEDLELPAHLGFDGRLTESVWLRTAIGTEDWESLVASIELQLGFGTPPYRMTTAGSGELPASEP